MACVDFLFRVSFIRGIEFIFIFFPPIFLVSFYRDGMGCHFFVFPFLYSPWSIGIPFPIMNESYA